MCKTRYQHDFFLKDYRAATIHMDSGKFKGQRDTACDVMFTVVRKVKKKKKRTQVKKKIAQLQREFRARKHD